MSAELLFDHTRAVAHRLADAARAETLAYFRSTSLGTENKAADGFDPVTLADRACEAAMRAILRKECPDDGIFGEEEGIEPGKSGLTWVLDPIDGTRAFLSGTPTWGVLIGLRDESGVLYGLIDQPWTGERFEGGGGAAQLTRAGETSPLATRDTASLSEAILFSTFPEIGDAEEKAAFDRVARETRLTRFGMDCYAYALLALGQIDLVIEAGLQPYDIVAPIGVVEAAGGIVTDWTGGPAQEGGRVIAAANPRLHAQALERLNG